MGKHARPSESRRAAVPAAAAFALVATGGAQFLGGGAAAAPPGGHTLTDAAGYLPARDVLAAKTTARVAVPARPSPYTIRDGDSLSLIASRLCGKVADWTGLWHANPWITDPNQIYPGKSLDIVCQSLPGLGTVVAAHWDPAPSAPVSTSPAPQPAPAPAPAPVPAGSLQAYAQQLWGSQYTCGADVVNVESGWNIYATNPHSHAYGIPQALPGWKMASAGADWQTDGFTQLRWMTGYMNGTYGGPCGAWAHEQADGWY